jgi:hypothetical protein
MKTQKEKILEHLKTRRQLTPLEALRRFGCFRLAARVKELREDGHHIHTTLVEVDHDTRVASYLLIKQAKRAA